MAEMDPLEVTEKIRNELILLAKGVKAGEVTPTVGNSVAKLYKTALYAEQVRAQKANNAIDGKQENNGAMELSDDDKKRLDKVAKLLEPKKRGKGAGKSGNNKA